MLEVSNALDTIISNFPLHKGEGSVIILKM
jgi:hypothetical protein